ncbi:SAM-dependent methyltransferase [Oscillatoriales cyanobacterium LEGE 11467]|uniref:S-adenosyl-L-methionine-dependent methyltransferase n=1 Tax=Zarconia navalis LEGE 11467 TaxID=1828826 RepID=A0A928ZA28_9CYAN|nr:SAM-dependent methyltransferase [Zarconia navalis]MBE9041336.1 SAM-dependent methyltransferase [Zarconia navalis LEGE 11467]
MAIEWKNKTNKGAAFLKLAHQYQSDILLEDRYIRWFFDESDLEFLKQNPLNAIAQPQDDEEHFQHLAYWYIILREKYGDRAIEASISAGCKQLILLGSGYDTRFFRLSTIKENSVKTFEIDLPETIEEKQKCLRSKLGVIPRDLSLISLDLNRDNLNRIFEYGFESKVPTIYVWQGVSYYLERDSISKVLDYIKLQMAPGSVFVFDCCSPLMTFKNDRIPGININIEHLAKIGEPYRFGMYGDEMEEWLKEKGFNEIEILQFNDLEEMFCEKRTFPANMWYIVTVRA